MVIDHAMLFFGGQIGEPVRLTVGRLAVPLFFVVSGHLFRRLSSRTLGVGLLGFLLPVLMPWLDSPNVLTWYALGACLLALFGRLRLPVAAIVVLGLVVGANGFGDHVHTYEATALFGLMAVGSMLPRSAFDWGNRLWPWLGRLGRYPITAYCVQAFALSTLAIAVYGGAS